MEKEANKNKLSYEELLAQLKDPALLQAAAAKVGLKVVKPEAKPTEKPKARERKEIKFPEDANLQQILETIQNGFKDMYEYVDGTITDKTTEIRNEGKQKEVQSEGAKIKDFIAKVGKEKFDKVASVMGPLYNKSRNLEDAFAKACKALDEENPLTKGTKKPTSKEDKTSSEDEEESSNSSPSRRIPSVRSEDSNDSGLREKTRNPHSLRDAAKSSLDKILSDKGVSEGEVFSNDEVE